MAVSKEDILETISNMSVMDVVDLISAMEEKFGVSAAAPVAIAAGPAGGGEAAAAEEQTEFLTLKAAELAEEKGVAPGGYRVQINCNPDGGQVVFHLHMHLMGGRKLECLT